MKSVNAQNERVKRSYFSYLKEARRYSDQSVDGVAAALSRFEAYTRFKDFKTFRPEQAVGFKRHLAEQLSQRSGQPLSKATLYSTLAALKNFFHWLAGQPGFRSRLRYSDADYFNLSEKEARIAKARRAAEGPTLDQVLHVIRQMPAETEIELRDRAVVAFALLTGARDNAIASIKLKHVDLAAGRVDQDAREVRTKFSKSFPTWFFPVGENIRQIVEEWVRFLREEKRWTGEEPLFPATKVSLGVEGKFQAAGLEKRHWSNADPIRSIFRAAFEAAGQPYFHPHSLRKTLVQLGEQLCRTPEEFKAWSQNLGHDKVMTTFNSYGAVAHGRQAAILQGMCRRAPTVAESEFDQIVKILAERLPMRHQ